MKNVRVTTVRWIPIFRAFCLPYVGVIVREEYKDDKALIQHEIIHLEQMRRMTFPVYVVRYVVQLIFIGYDTMPMELEARQPQGELFNYRKKIIGNGKSSNNKSPEAVDERQDGVRLESIRNETPLDIIQRDRKTLPNRQNVFEV